MTRREYHDALCAELGLDPKKLREMSREAIAAIPVPKAPEPINQE